MTTASALPDARGHFGPFGGQFIPETLVPAIEQLCKEYEAARQDPKFHEQLDYYRRRYVGRPTPLYFAARLTELWGGAKVYFKREDLAHTGSHKINNTLGQALVTRRMGKTRIIAETGAGQHGVATATAAALFGLECEVFMGEEDIRRQALNVFRMKLLGAKVTPVAAGSRTLKDATNEAFRNWMATVRDTHYVIGSVVGPHPYPMMVRDFQSVIGREVIEQIRECEGRLPDYCIACVGGGSNSMGLFYPFVPHEEVKLVGVEAGGVGMDVGQHAASISQGALGVLHGSASYVLQDEDGQTAPVHSIAAGLDYPGVGPEHSYLYRAGRAQYVSVSDREALDAFRTCAQREGIIPALESAHAVAYAAKLVPTLPKDAVVVVNMSGRGDKDCMEVSDKLALEETGGES